MAPGQLMAITGSCSCKTQPTTPRREMEKKKGDNNNRVTYRQAFRIANEAIIQARQDAYSQHINAAGRDPHKRWSVIRDILHHAGHNEISAMRVDCQAMWDGFSHYFDDKIKKIKAIINQRFSGDQSDPTADNVFDGIPLADLPPPSVQEVAKLIAAIHDKSSPIDIIPTSIIKSCCDVFAPYSHRLAALSLSEGDFPSRYKTAAVTSLFKKKGPDRHNTANNRPIFNLHPVSKIVHRLFLSRVAAHMENSPRLNQLQSTYRRGYSTKPALLTLSNDIYQSADDKS
jgi:hypothetical protein